MLPRGPEPCELGQKASIQIDPPAVITGKIVRVTQTQNGSNQSCEIGLSGPLPGSALGRQVGALIEVGELKNVVFFERPADSSPNSEAPIFVIEPGDHFARRVVIHYGQIPGPLIQVVDGLSPGDRVIVTDMSKWSTRPRVRLQ
jgi:HlyD family secretion protein